MNGCIERRFLLVQPIFLPFELIWYPIEKANCISSPYSFSDNGLHLAMLA